MRPLFEAALCGLDLHLRRKARLYAVLIVAHIPLFLLVVLFVPPAPLGTQVSVVVEEGTSFRTTAEALEEKGVTSSALFLRVFARITGADANIHAGEYRFEQSLPLAPLLYRLTNGETGIPVVRVTFPEGVTVREMALILSASLPGFDSVSFEREARGYEGYLFPDTYLIPEDATTESILRLLQDNFTAKVEMLTTERAASLHTFTDVVIMASLLEKEARTPEERRIIAGILWDRIEIGMPLQVDAVFGYIKGIDTYHPSGDDLVIDSPYNTYEYRGLPRGPIGNPGLDALMAALLPTETEYLYYLTGTDGVTRYARTFEEHKDNKETYLR